MLPWVKARKLREARERWNKVDEDVVVLHMFPRGDYLNLSPYPIKIELFMRANNINYVTESDFFQGAKGKTPWITLNGTDVPDSTLAIEHLSKHFNIDMNSHLSPSEKAIAKGMRHMMEDHCYWAFLRDRFDFSKGLQMTSMMPAQTVNMKRFIWRKIVGQIAKGQVKNIKAQGMGMHTVPEVVAFVQKTIQAISDFLGDKKYMMGDKLTELDCSLFGFLYFVQYAPHEGSPLYDGTGIEKHENIINYVDNILQEYFPDKDELIAEGKKDFMEFMGKESSVVKPKEILKT